MKYFVSIMFLIWEAPQNTLGALLFLFVYAFHNPKIEVRNLRLFIQCNLGISLGSFVFWVKYPENMIFKLSDTNKFHEYGHSIQSKIFGPFYLIIIGVPSVIRAIYACFFYRLKKKSWNNYYLGFPENWADRLGGVLS